MPALQDHFVVVASRTGYAAKGAVYLLLGALAIASGFTSLEEEGSTGLLDKLAETIAGRIVLIPLAIGLSTYVVWRLLQFFFDTEDKGNTPRGWALRLCYLASGIAYTSIANAAIQATLHGTSGNDSEQSAQSWSAFTLSLPGGRFLLAGFALGVLLFAAQQLRRAWKQDFRDKFPPDHLKGALRTFVLRSSCAGFATRALVFLVLGGYLIQAAWWRDPDEVHGFGGALRTIHNQPFGPWLLGAVGIGLGAYGVYGVARAAVGTVGRPSRDDSKGGSNR